MAEVVVLPRLSVRDGTGGDRVEVDEDLNVRTLREKYPASP
ncbi:MAG TPA: hypothetical protein VFO01_14225 [Trebonia sp.]|nr:hypothetical protein [Trebonia sp.]